MIHNRKRIKRYALVSAISGAADYSLFTLLYILLKRRSMKGAVIIAVIFPRLVSSVINYTMHKKYTFGCTLRRSSRRYALLSSGILVLCCSGMYLCSFVLPEYVLLLKPVCDAMLGILTARANCRWVFAEDTPEHFYGDYARFIKRIARMVLPNYAADDFERRHAGEPVVYVCRHGNMHGPITTLANLSADVHPMVLDCFFEKESCRKHFDSFTFSSRFGYSRPTAKFLANLSAAVTVPIMHSLQAIPVHRNSCAISTLRASLRYLERGEAVIVFPDVCYTASEGDGDIYCGFVALGQMYLKSTGKPLSFVPLIVDDENRRIIAQDSFEWNKGCDRQEAADYIRRAIHSEISSTKPDAA